MSDGARSDLFAPAPVASYAPAYGAPVGMPMLAAPNVQYVQYARPASTSAERVSEGSKKVCKFLAGSFSAVSKRNFARKYAFDSIFQALEDVHIFVPLQTQHFSKKSV